MVPSGNNLNPVPGSADTGYEDCPNRLQGEIPFYIYRRCRYNMPQKERVLLAPVLFHDRPETS
jgi:hypothetical protein